MLSNARLDHLLATAWAVLPPDLRTEVIVFGSAPLVLAGLKPDAVNDLDLFASRVTYEALRDRGFAEANEGFARILLAPDIELYPFWPGVSFEEAFVAALETTGSHGFKVVSLAHVLAYKRTTNRPKDQDDIALLERSIAT